MFDLDQVYCIDVMDGLRQLPDGLVKCVVTSIPYYGLRDYGTATWIGGDPMCAHSNGGKPYDTKSKHYRGADQMTLVAGNRGGLNHCIKCGAQLVDPQIGQEQTISEYVERIAGVFREVWRVLADDGTLWINIGDSMASGKGQSGAPGPEVTSYRKNGKKSINGPEHHIAGKGQTRRLDDSKMLRDEGVRNKSLLGMPWRVAFALMDMGWILRNEIVWYKPNPQPESVEDRFTRAHEQIFFFAKSEQYYFDQNAVREPQTGNAHSRGKGNGLKFAPKRSQIRYNESFSRAISKYTVVPGGRNRRDVWKVPFEPSRERHWAAYPTKLILIPILAGSREGDLILDPFVGTGTTPIVARALKRRYLGFDISPKYIRIAKKRLRQPFTQWEPVEPETLPEAKEVAEGVVQQALFGGL